MIDQITVFLENKEGHLADLVRTVAKAGVNMEALTVADTSAYGLVRIICGDPACALKALDEAGYRATLTKVIAVNVENVPGGLAKLLDVLDEQDVNIEYAYCFSHQSAGALDILKVRNANAAVKAIEDAGFAMIEQADLA